MHEQYISNHLHHPHSRHLSQIKLLPLPLPFLPSVGVGQKSGASGRRGPSVGWGKPVVPTAALSPSAVYLGKIV